MDVQQEISNHRECQRGTIGSIDTKLNVRLKHYFAGFNSH